METLKTGYSHLLSAFALSSALVAGGCGEDKVNPMIDLIDRTTKSLTLGSLLEVNGTYGAECANRSGSWSVGIGGFATLDNSLLSVIKNDTTCALSLTSIRVGSSMDSSVFIPASDFALGSSYQSNGASFRLSSMDPIAFYSNARISPDLSFASNFTIQLVYSDDPSLTTASKNASFDVKSASASASNISPPDYTIDMAALTIQVDVNDVVQSASGTATLTDVSVSGQSYVVVSSLAATPSYDDVDAAYTGGTPGTLTGTNPTVPASAFNLVSVDLTTAQKRYLIVANTSSGTRSYEVFTITFNAP